MNQSTISLNSLKSSKCEPNDITNANHTSDRSIMVSELSFQTEITERKRIEAPKTGLLFVFNLKDSLHCNISTDQEINLGSFQSIMIAPSEHRAYVDLVFPEKSNHHVCLITIDKIENLGNFKEDLLKTNFKSQSNHDCWFTGLPNVKLSNFIYDLMSLNTSFSGNQHLLIGYTNIIIGSKLAEYNQYTNGPKKEVDLRNDEIDRIHQCINFIKENYAQQLDVDMLCLKASLTPQKLQTGFRALYGNTVTSFIKNFRLQKAEELMRTTELNVSQIVYSIGLTSRSYFSKIFKEKYEISPNDYVRKFKFQVA